MNQFNQKTCALYGCDNTVSNWRQSCCCPTHQRQYAAKKRHGTENQPNKTKKDMLAWARHYVTDRELRKRKAMPVWADPEKIKGIYMQAARLSEETGIPHEVDHIIPLTHKSVCGLHVETNLQIITRTENRSKYNKFIIE